MRAGLLGCWLCVAALTAAAPARPPAAALLPEHTSVLVSVMDVPELTERFSNTSFGRMFQDPQVKPLVDYVYGSMAQAVSRARERIGLSLPELLAIPQGELTLAVVTPEGRTPEVVVLLDAGDQWGKVQGLLKRGAEALERSGADRSEETVDGTRLVKYQAVGPRRRTAAWFEKEGTLVLGSSIEVLKEVLAIWNGADRPVLGKDADFAAIMKRSGGPGDRRPQVLWYVDPLGLMESIGVEQTGPRVALALFPALGLDGLRAAGGSLTLDAAPFDLLFRLHVLLDRPRDGVLELLALRTGPSEPEPWVPATAASYTTWYMDLPGFLRSLRTLFDSFRGDGALDAFLQGRIQDQIGVDVEGELLPLLSGRVTHVSQIERPFGPRSGATLLALGLKDAKAAGQLLEKVYQENEAFLVRRALGRVRYLCIEPPGARALGEEGEPPRPSVGILGDSLVLADRESLFRQAAVTLAGSAEPLSSDEDYQAVAARVFDRSGGAKPSLVRFSRPAEPLRLAYEMVTRGPGGPDNQPRPGQGPGGRMLRAALEARLVPPFEAIQPYLMPGGAMLTEDQSGLHYMGFVLQRGQADR